MEDPHTRYSKRLRTGTRRRYQDDGISDDEIEGKRTFNLEEKLQSQRFNSNLVKHMEGKDFTFEYIQREGIRDPLVFEKSDGLGLEMPDPDFSVSDVKLFVGSRRMVDVMDVTTQKGIEMSMAQWRRYYETPPSEREKLYNVISLEFSHTKLENLVKRPASVDLIDWVDNMWPRHLKERQRDSTNAIIDMHYPKVQKYCLMSVQGCFTDFHIDFGGTSVWYHILRGGKVFWLIPPTPQNLELYENWVLSGKQGDIFLGDKASDCQRIELKQGYTFMIPSGWIHAVYTPEDTLVFGGNFLHSFNIPMQLNIYSIEDRTRVPAKFRYPFYYEMCWYVLERYLYCLTNISHLTPEFQKHSLGIGDNGHARDGPSDPNREEGAGPARDEDGSDIKAEVVEEEVVVEEEEEEEEAAPPPSKPGVKVHLTQFELEGLWNLLGKLEELPDHKKCLPVGIRNAPALLHDMRALLEEHATDNPKLSYSGEPIVKWPKRPSWYQPPTSPPTVLYRPRLGPSLPRPLVQRPTKPASSISALRRRRVRCKRCEGCTRKECGDCTYCHDMRKFGGPGRMKKGCMMRQCVLPCLPNTARCVVCGEGEPDELSQTLMECSNCAQIAHPECITVPGEGKINNILPSCWECPKCYQGKGSAAESSSDEGSVASDGSVSTRPPKRLHREGIGVGQAARRGRRGRPPSSRTTPPPSQRLLLQQQQNRKRAGVLELRLKKRIKLERSKILQAKQSSPRLLVSRGVSRLRSPSGRQAHGRGRGAWRNGSRHGSPYSQTTPRHGFVLEARAESRRQRGRGVRLRGGGAGRGMRSGRSHRDMEESEDDSSSSSSSGGGGSSSSSSDDQEEEGERRESGPKRGILDKENRPQKQGGRSAKEKVEEEEEAIGEANLNGAEEEEGGVEMEESKASQAYPVSDVTVTLQRLSKTQRDPAAIVPKLEAAIAPRSGPNPQSLKRPPIRIPSAAPDRNSARPDRYKLTRGNHAHSRGSQGERAEAPRRTKPDRPEKINNGTSSSASRVPPLRIPLSALQEGGSAEREKEVENGGSEPGCEREVWVSVFRYLTRAELCVCMAVCKNWYKWSLDKRLWTRINLGTMRTITPQALSGIIKRQPMTLDLSWTNISKKQLSWLINRLPGLKDLTLARCPWSSISALSSPSCPLLRALDLGWANGVKDGQIRDLLNPPGCDNRSQLRNMQYFRLSGLEISDSTIRLVIRHMPQLTRLDLSHCNALTDQSINLLTAVGSSTRNTLTELNLGGCSKLTDNCLKFLRRLSCLSRLNLRACKGVSRKACEAFISELSVNTLYCLSEDKLIQRIS
ncbi:lysine-specific demethylase 2A [Aplochiton taeniatus]